MKQKIIVIDQEKCSGCGLCVKACHEGAIGIRNKKALLLREDYCDGLGACLPVCPENAISFEMREAAVYNTQAAKKNKIQSFGKCPGEKTKILSHENQNSRLSQWPVQLQLTPSSAPFFQNAKLLLAADCTAFAYKNFHERFIKDHITLIGCPKLDTADYAQKIYEILTQNEIAELMVVRMSVPCCGGLIRAAEKALAVSGKCIPLQVITLSSNGSVLPD